MGFISILDNGKSPKLEDGMPGFFIDLNLDQIINRIQELTESKVKKYYYCLPETKECEIYRRSIYSDVKKTKINELLTEFVQRMEERKVAAATKKDVDINAQRHVWHLLEVAVYCDAFTKLYEGLKEADIQSEGLQSLLEYLDVYVTEKDFVDMRSKAYELRAKLQSFQVKLIYENDQWVVSYEAATTEYEDFLRATLGEYNAYMKSPFAGAINLNNLEQEIVEKFMRKETAFFRDLRGFYQNYPEYARDVLLQFGEEINYYLSYAVFQRKMEWRGWAFATPTADEAKDISACGLYDLALVLANAEEGKPVVSNDMTYCKGETFFVVTGPNQGGKTTFARSLGQLIYFSKMGLDVPATAANVHSFSKILTHFSVEESVETGRGKLMEELTRLKPMMNVECQNAFVIINELFTTAANYDACIMGKKVLEHFIEQGCRGIYVTHLKELCESHESVVSMRAMLDENKIQSFKIDRREADDTMCALNQVNKYRLTYEQLKERLG